MAIVQAALLALLLAAPVKPSLVVRQAPHGKIDVDARNATLSDILDRIGQKTGMKVVYEGPAPRQRITLTLRGRRPAEAVAEILQGQGLNYGLVLDSTQTRVAELLVSGAAPPGAARPRPTETTPEPTAAVVVEEDTGTPEVETTVVEWQGRAQPPADAGLPPGSVPPPPGMEDPAAVPAEGGDDPIMQPLVPPTTYSHSPFGPKPVILVPPAPAPTPTPQPTPPPGSSRQP
jgi:hypothetical protein